MKINLSPIKIKYTSCLETRSHRNTNQYIIEEFQLLDILFRFLLYKVEKMKNPHLENINGISTQDKTGNKFHHSIRILIGLIECILQPYDQNSIHPSSIIRKFFVYLFSICFYLCHISQGSAWGLFQTGWGVTSTDVCGTRITGYRKITDCCSVCLEFNRTF